MLNKNQDLKKSLLDENFFEEIGNTVIENHKVIPESEIKSDKNVDIVFSNDALLVNATLTLTSSTAMDSATKKPVNFSKKIPLINGVNWLTIVHKNPKNSIYIETEVILNGKVVLKKQLYNQHTAHIPSLWVKKYPEAQFGRDIGWMRFLNFHSYNPKNQEAIWKTIKKDPKIKKDDLGFIKDYQKFFQDNIKLQLNYPQGKIEKTETIAYANGVDMFDYPTGTKNTLTDFEYVQSFAIVVREKVSDNLLKYWTLQKNKYPIGYLKAAYGTFLSALVTIQTHDDLANKTAQELGIKWNRPKTILVMNGIKHNYNYLHIPDNSMGMISSGDSNQKKTFNFACSSILSVIEDFNLNSMAFPVNSVLIGTGLHMLKGGRTALIQEKQGQFEITIPKRPNVKILIDQITWHVKDIIGYYKGSISAVPAYCYQNRQTDLITQLADKLLNQKCEWLIFLSSIVVTLGSTIFGMVRKGVIPPEKKDNAKHLAALMIGIGGLFQAYSEGLTKEINRQNFANFLWDFGSSVVPIFKLETSVGKLYVNYIGRNGLRTTVTQLNSKFEGYVLTTMKASVGDVFVGGKVIEPIYVTSVQYIKYGTVESVIRTTFGKTPKEAVKRLVLDQSIGKAAEIVINTYTSENDTYKTKIYKNITEYLNS